MRLGAKGSAVLMTEGPIWKNLLFFAIPLLIGNLFQQLYNTVDSMIVGNFVGRHALAAVGTTENIINAFIGFFFGLGAGSSVVISQYYGAQDDLMVSRSVQTTITAAIILSLACAVGSQFLLPTFLRITAIPDDVYNEAFSYLKIIFYGMPGLLIYNLGSAIMRAVGDSRRPLYFLLFSTISNITLDLFFVAKLGWGVEGAAVATIVSQYAAAILVMAVLTIESGSYRIKWGSLGIDWKIFSQIFRIGLPGSIQMTITATSNVFVQSYINDFGSAVMGGWASYSKIDKVCMLPMMSISMAASTFVGQNLGAGLVDRAQRGVKVGSRLSLGIALPIIAIVIAFREQIVMLFNQDPLVVEYGSLFIGLNMIFFVFMGRNQILSGSLRGAGNTKIPVLLMMSSFIAFRQIYLFIASHVSDSIIPISLGYPMGWMMASLLLTIYYSRVDLSKYVVTKKTSA